MGFDHQNLGQPLKIATKWQAFSFEIIKIKTISFCTKRYGIHLETICTGQIMCLFAHNVLKVAIKWMAWKFKFPNERSFPPVFKGVLTIRVEHVRDPKVTFCCVIYREMRKKTLAFSQRQRGWASINAHRNSLSALADKLGAIPSSSRRQQSNFVHAEEVGVAYQGNLQLREEGMGGQCH